MIDGTRENKTKIKQRPQYNLYIPLRWNTCWNLYCYSPQYLSHWRHLPDYKQHRAWGSLWPVGKEAPVFQGQARSGTLVQYGDESNNCGAINLQFDAGRGTTQRLSQAKTPIGKLSSDFLYESTLWPHWRPGRYDAIALALITSTFFRTFLSGDFRPFRVARRPVCKVHPLSIFYLLASFLRRLQISITGYQ